MLLGLNRIKQLIYGQRLLSRIFWKELNSLDPNFYIHWGFLIFYIPAEIIYLKFTGLIGFEKFNTMFKICEFNVAKDVCFINFDVLKGILEYTRGLVIAYSLVW